MLYCDYYYVKAHFLSLNCYCIIITYYYKLSITYYYLLPYYKFIDTYYYIIISSFKVLLHYYHFYKGKSCKNETLLLIRGNHVKMEDYYELFNEYASIPLLHHYYILSHHYYTGDHYHSVCVWEKNAKMLGIINTVTVLCLLLPLLTATLCHQLIYLMIFFFCPLLEIFCHFFEHIALFGSRLPRWYFILPTFKIQARKRGVLGCE